MKIKAQQKQTYMIQKNHDINSVQKPVITLIYKLSNKWSNNASQELDKQEQIKSKFT